jgi:outer membrane protein assembly factor BamE (lipoprotein component of BamABCDE complex)
LEKKEMKKQILFWLIVSISLTSCKSITSYFPKQPRPFQKKEFNSEQWKNSDYQTRGEMVSRTLIDQIYQIKSNHQEEILKLFGKPDQVTKAVCCYAGRAGKSGEKDLWLYYIETEQTPNVANKNETPLKQEALKIYFDTSSINPNVGERDGNHDYFPAIGYFKLEGRLFNLGESKWM